jgi:hypothetical protein
MGHRLNVRDKMTKIIGENIGEIFVSFGERLIKYGINIMSDNGKHR